MANYTIQSPPTLGFPSREKLEEAFTSVNTAISSVDIVEIRPYYPPQNGESSRQRNIKACAPCSKRHAKCHGRAENSSCSKPNCKCEFHAAAMMEGDTPSPTAFTYPDEPPSTTGIRRPGLLCTRHFAGETSFCAYIPKRNQPRLLVPELPITVPISYPRPPTLTTKEQQDLIDVYYENMSPYFPFINKSILYNQHSLFMQAQPCYLSPLFFCAVFSRAAHIIGDQTTQDGRSFEHVGEQFMEYALALRGCYHTQSSISTVLALVIMANQLEQTKRYKSITLSWILAGEAFRMVVDIGIHRMGSLNEFETEDQLCIRAFWLAYVTDATISLSYGRPSAVEDKILDVVAPRTLDTDDDIIKHWVQALSDILSLSKISVRIVRFNYSPPPIFYLEGPIKRHNAFLASMDSWLTDIRYPLNEDKTESSGQLAEVKERLKFQKNLFFLTDLILLHRPYIDDTNDRSHPSLDICSYAAVLIIFRTYELGEASISYHANLPMLSYSLIIALRIMIMNAANNTNCSKYNSSKVCELGLHILAKLPQTQSSESILFDALDDLRKHFYNREAPPVYEDEVVYIAQRVPTQLRPADRVIFGGPDPQIPEPGPSNGGSNNNLTMIHYPQPRRVGQRTGRGGSRGSRSHNHQHVFHASRPVSQRPRSNSRRGSRRDSTSSSRSQQQRPTNQVPSDTSSQQSYDVDPDFIQMVNPGQTMDPNMAIFLQSQYTTNQTEVDNAFLQLLQDPYNQDVDGLTSEFQNASMEDSLLQNSLLNLPLAAAPFPAFLSWAFHTTQEFIDHEQEISMMFDQNDYLPQAPP